MVNGATEGEVEDSGKHVEHDSVSSAFIATDTSHQVDKGERRAIERKP